MTLGEAAMRTLRAFGSEGALAEDVAHVLRRTGFPEANTPGVAEKLRKYTRKGAARVTYSTVREGDTERPAEQEERFFA